MQSLLSWCFRRFRRTRSLGDLEKDPDSDYRAATLLEIATVGTLERVLQHVQKHRTFTSLNIAGLEFTAATVSEITDAMKGNLEGDDEKLKVKYITAMNISWEKQNSRELYLSMLKEFILNCTEDDMCNKKFSHFHSHLEEIYTLEREEYMELSIKLLKSKCPEIIAVVFDKMPEESFDDERVVSAIVEDYEEIPKETLDLLLKHCEKCTRRLISTARSLKDHQQHQHQESDSTDCNFVQEVATLVLLWVLRKASFDSISTAMDRHALLDDDMRPLDVKQYSAGSDLKSAVEEAATRGLQFTTVAVDLFDHGCRKKMVCPNAPNKGAVALSSIVELLERNHIADHTLHRILVLQKRAIKEYCKFHTTEAAEKLWDLFKNCVFKGKDRTSAELYDLGNYCESHEANKMKNRALKSILHEGSEDIVLKTVEKHKLDLSLPRFEKDQGFNILHTAASENYTKLSKYVVERGYQALLQLRTPSGQYPVQIALEKENYATAAVLLKAMNDWELCFSRKKKECDVCFYDLLKKMKDEINKGKRKTSPRSCSIKDCILAVLDSTVDEKGVVHHQVLESDRNGRTPDDNESFDLERGTCVDLIFDLTATHKIQAIAEHKSFRTLVNLKWDKFGQKYYLFPLMMFVLFLVLFTTALVLASKEENPSNYRGSLNGFRLFCEIVVTLYLVGDILLEVFEFIRTYDNRFRSYISDWANPFDILAYVFTALILPFRIINSDYQWIFASLAYIFHCFRIFEYTIMSSFMGTYLEVLIRIMYEDVTRFMAVFMVFVLAFGGGLYFALRGEPCGLYQSTNGTALGFSVDLNTSHCLHPDETSEIYLAWLTGIRLLSEGSVIDPYIFGELGFRWLGVIVYLVFLFLVGVVLLNLLIAQMSNSYLSVLAKAKVSVIITRAKLLARLRNSLWICALKKLKKDFLKKITKKLYSDSSNSSQDSEKRKIEQQIQDFQGMFQKEMLFLRKEIGDLKRQIKDTSTSATLRRKQPVPGLMGSYSLEEK